MSDTRRTRHLWAPLLSLGIALGGCSSGGQCKTTALADLGSSCSPTYAEAVAAGCGEYVSETGHGPCGAFIVSYSSVAASFTACFYDPTSEQLVGVLGSGDTSGCSQAGELDPTCGGMSPGENVPPRELPTVTCGPAHDAGLAEGATD